MLLSIYLNDHLAGATAGRDLARRAASSTRNSDRRTILAEVSQEIDEDRDTLLAIMSALGVRVDLIKTRAAWLAEKIGRLKLNGKVRDRSPMTDVVELEALALGVAGKRACWVALELLQLDARTLQTFDLLALRQRADRQFERLEAQRQDAIVDAFPDPQP